MSRLWAISADDMKLGENPKDSTEVPGTEQGHAFEQYLSKPRLSTHNWMNRFVKCSETAVSGVPEQWRDQDDLEMGSGGGHMTIQMC